MNAIDQLGLLAEIAATFLGFIAVFLAVSGRDGRFAAGDGHFVQGLVLSCSLVILLGMAPGVAFLSFSAEQVWPVASAVAAACISMEGLYVGWTQSRIHQRDEEHLHFLWHVPSWSFAGLALGAMVVAIFYPGSAPTFYVTGLYFGLAVALWCFLTIVFRRFL